MTKEFDNKIIGDLSERFGGDVAERFKGKELLDSVKSFYGTEDNYMKHTKGIELDVPDLGSPLGDLNIGDVAEQVFDSIKNNKPLLFLVGDSKEQDVLEVMLKSMKTMLGDYGEQVNVVRLKDFSESMHHIKSFSKEMAMEDDDEFNVVSVGAGFSNGFVDTFANRKSMGATSAKFSFINTGKPDTERKFKHSLSTSFENGINVSLTEVMGRAVNEAMGKLSEDSEFDTLFIKTYMDTVGRLSKFGNQVSGIDVPLELRTESRSDLSLFTSLSSKFGFFKNLGWCRQMSTDMSDDAKLLLSRALGGAGVDRAEFYKLVDSLAQANVKAGVINRALAKRQASGDSAPSGAYDLANELSLLSESDYSTLNKKDHLHDLKINIISLEMNENRSATETAYLGMMKTQVLSMQKANRQLRSLLKKSRLIESNQIGSTNLCFFNTELFKHIDKNYLRGLVSTPLDGSVILAPSEPAQSSTASFYASGAIKGEVQKLIDGKENVFSVGNVSAIGIDGIWGQDVTKENFIELAKDIEGISRKLAAAKAADEAPVIVAEPDSLGKALGIMNYINAGHSNGIDANIHFRIPRKEKLRVTRDSGEVEYMTVAEIVASGDNFETIECLYKAEKSENYNGVKSVYLSKEDLVAMHADLGKKRFYGPLKTKFSAKGDTGNLHVVGYDANFEIRYKKDILLKSDSKKKNVINDSFWREMNKKGNVQHIKLEQNIKDVNGVNVNADENFSVFKQTILETIDRMNGGADLNGECAMWCCDTETTGLEDADDLINFGGSAYSVVKNSGEVVESDMLFVALDGNTYVIDDDADAIDITDQEASTLSLSEVVQFPDGTFFKLTNARKVDNVGLMADGRSVINRRLEQTYVTALINDFGSGKVPREIEKLTGLSGEQVEKYGLTMQRMEEIFKDEASKFKKNCFTFHNSSFDTNVLAVNSLGIANTMLKDGNFVADTLAFAKDSRPTSLKKDVYSMSYGKSVSVQFSDKDAVMNFLKNGKAGDELQCLKGSLAFDEDKKGTLRLRLKNGAKGIYHKDFDPDVREERVLDPLFESGTYEAVPSVTFGRKRMIFENAKALNNFIAGGAEGEKFRSMDDGYLQVFEGNIYAYPKGVATSAKKICAVGDTDVVKFTDKAILCNKMDHFVGLQKVVDMIEVAFPAKDLTADKIAEVAGSDIDAKALTLLKAFEHSYDYTRTLLENKSNFESVYGEGVIPSAAMEAVSAASIAENKERVFALKNMDAIKAVAPSIETTGLKRETVEAEARKVGVPASVAMIAAKSLAIAKKKTKVKEVFLNQSHNNATRFNSDACIELPVATTTMFRSNRNSYDTSSSVKAFVNGIGKSALKASHDAATFISKIPAVSSGTEQALGLFKKRSGTLAKLGVSSFAPFDFGAGAGKAVYSSHLFINNNRVSKIREISKLISGFAKVKAGKVTGSDPLGVFFKDSMIIENIDNLAAIAKSKMDEVGLAYAGVVEDLLDESLIKDNVRSLYLDRYKGKADLDSHKIENKEILEEDTLKNYEAQFSALENAAELLPVEEKAQLEKGIEDLREGVLNLDVMSSDEVKSLDFDSISIDMDVPDITSSELDALNDAVINVLASSAGMTLGDYKLELAKSTVEAEPVVKQVQENKTSLRM